MTLLPARWQFHIFLLTGFLALIVAVVALASGDYRVFIACLLMAAASPGLMSQEGYSYHLPSRNALIRSLATWGSNFRSFCLLLAFVAITLMYVELLTK
ncbi:hypothetical protein D2B43_17840 [Salmonella enterica]|nr:hypothetical protein [Salmonella enterica]